MNKLEFSQLSDKQQELIKAAEGVRGYSYSPYSRFQVGAALRTTSGNIYTGTNVEFASIKGVHAEISAINSMLANNERAIECFAISARSEDFDTEQATSPCGSCRQAIFEFAQLNEINIEIIAASTNRSDILVTSIESLLPGAFGPGDIGVHIEQYRGVK